MITLSHKQIKNIADEIACGFRCYVHKISGDIKTLPDESHHPGMEMETDVWENDRNEIENHFDEYIKFEPMSSNESYRFMEEFIGIIDDVKLQTRLANAISRSHPFRNFNSVIDESGPYRERWFAFKEEKIIETIKAQFEIYCR